MKQYQTLWQWLIVCVLLSGCLFLAPARADYHLISQTYLNGTPQVLVLDPALHRIYIVASIGGTSNPQYELVVVESLHNTVLQTLNLGAAPLPPPYSDQAIGPLAINPLTHRLYLFDATKSSVLVIDARSVTVVATISVANVVTDYGSPIYLDINPATNKIYIDGATNLDVIDGNTNHLLSTLNFHVRLGALAINTRTNRVYVAQYSVYPNSPALLNVLDGSVDKLLTTVPLPQFAEIAAVVVNSLNNRIYELNSFNGNQLNVLDGATNTVLGTTSFPPTYTLRLDERTDTLYALNRQALTVVPGAAYQSQSPPATAVLPGSTGDFVIDPFTGNIYAVDSSGHMLDILKDVPASYSVNSVSGYVTTAAGAPIPNLTVRCTGQKPLQTQTDSHGYYSFSGLYGLYNIQPAFSSQYTFNPATRTVSVESGSATHIDFIALTGYYLSGRVTNANGVGVSGVRLTVRDVRDQKTILATTYTNGNGYYGFSDLPQFYGDDDTPQIYYFVTPSDSGYSFAQLSRLYYQYATTALDFIAYPAPSILGAFELPYSGSALPPFPTNVTVTLTGTVAATGTRIARRISLTIPVGSDYAGFGFGALPPGTYTLTPFSSNYVYDPPMTTVTVTSSHNVSDVVFYAYPLSLVQLSSALAQASTDTVALRFTGAIANGNDITLYRVKIAVNGRSVMAESSMYNDAANTITLSLAPDALHRGDRVQVSAYDLQDPNNALLRPLAVNLIAQ